MPFSNHAISLESLNIYNGFDAAATAVLEFLNQRIGMGLWMITRTQLKTDQWVVLHSIDHGYGVRDGQVINWSSSFCSKMVKGEGPRIAPDSRSVKAYADQERGLKLTTAIRSYIGMPVMADDGSLFGTICAISPQKLPPEVEKEQPLLEMLSRLLGTVLAADRREAEVRREAEMARAEANRDALTGLYNVRGLNELADHEEERCKRYGCDAGVLSVDLNGLKQINDTQGHAAGDETIRLAAQAMKRSTRKSDIVARVGGDEFVIIAVESGKNVSADMVGWLREAFVQTGISAAIGFAQRFEGAGIPAAIKAADASMYENKKAMRAELQKRSA